MKSFALIDQLAQDVPGLAPMLAEHIADYDEVLPHLFFGELTPFLIGLKNGSDADRAVLVKALSMLEEAWKEGHEDVTNVIAVSFIETLQGYGDLRAMQTFFGPEMSNWADRFEEPHVSWLGKFLRRLQAWRHNLQL
jgi:hypothetical protein